MEADLFSTEIADLESFIDSYVGEREPEVISTEVFTNTNAQAGEYNHTQYPEPANSLQSEHFNDFQEELLEHQRKQESLQDEHPVDLPPLLNWGFQQDGFREQPHLNGYQNSQSMQSWQIPLNTENYLSHPMVPPQYTDHTQQGNGLPDPSFPPYYTNQDWVGLANSQNYNGVYAPNMALEKCQGESYQSGPLNVPPNDRKTSRNIRYRPPHHSENGNARPHQRKHSNSYNNMLNRRKSSETSVNECDSLSWRQPHELSPNESHSQKDGLKKSMETNGYKEKPTHGDGSKTSSTKPETRKKYTPPKARYDQAQHSRQSSQSSSTDSTTNNAGSKVVSVKSKAAVKSWLRSDKDSKNSTPIEKQIKNMGIPQKKDLPKLIKTAQNYIKTDKEMREVAEMVCNKAMRNPLFAENGAILCNEMSHRLTNGTNFRTIVLNIVQGHYKNRHQLMLTSIKNPRDMVWIGFTTFLVELYITLRTSSNERLKALISPVFDCFFQMLREKILTPDIAKCFTCNLFKVGSILERSNREKMAEFISLLRDKCVLPNDLSLEAKRCLLQSLENYARGWKNHALDDLCCNKFRSESNAN